jgi:hypothetical protein
MAIVVSMIGCGRDEKMLLMKSYARLDAISAQQWEILAQRKIFFGHKSVGQNIIEGLGDVMRARPNIRLNIRETIEPNDFVQPIFGHSPIGTNKAPLTKISRFCELMEGGLGDKLDVAFFKFCFIDIDHGTDLDELYGSYNEVIGRLHEKYPAVKIITVTVPLMSKPYGIKEKLKKLLGRLPWEEEDNIRRNRYNEMLRESFNASLFDLAENEATLPSGERRQFTRAGKTMDLLWETYTDDGGHLNKMGRQIAAIELLLRLATD